MNCALCRGCGAPRSAAQSLPRLALAGLPNSGKSTLFNALTGGHAHTGNWHGVTVRVAARTADLGGLRAQVFDLPGLYAAEAYTREEEAARAAVAGEYELAVCVADASALPRALPLLNALRAAGRPAVLVLTMADVFARRGGRLDVSALSRRLGVPAVAVNAHSRKDVARLRTFLRAALQGLAPARCGQGTGEAARSCTRQADEGEKAAARSCPEGENGAGEAPAARELLRGVWEPGRAEGGRLEKLLYTPAAALPLFAACFLAVFFLAFGPCMPGTLLKGAVETLVAGVCGEGLARLAAPSCAALAAFVRALSGGIAAVLSFLPQLFILYAALFLLEESGCMSALAFHTDGLFGRVGLTGRAVFSLLMGFGCTAAAVCTTRGLENARLQRRVVAILPYLPCSAKLPVYLMLVSAFFGGRFFALLGLYLAGVLIAAAVSAAAGRGEETFAMEMARLQRPPLRAVGRSLACTLGGFLAKTGTVVAAVLAAVWLLLSFDFSFAYVGAESGRGMLAVLSRGLVYLFYPMGITRWEVALAAFTGLAAKESVAGTLALFFGDGLASAMSAPSAAAFAAFLLTCSPCVSAIAAAARETGTARALGMAALQTATAFAFSYTVYAFLVHGALCAVLLAALAPFAAAAVLFGGARHEKTHRRKRAAAARLHRRKLRAGLLRLFAPAARGGDPRQRRAGQQKRHAGRGGRGDLVHHPQRGGAALLRRRLRGRKRAGGR